jgi:hypothetical protein
MSSLRTWFRGPSSTGPPKATTGVNPSPIASEIALNGSGAEAQLAATAELEAANMEDAMAAAGLIMNDDIEGAEARLSLKKDSSTFHLLAFGVATFMKSILGFEKEIMAEAASRLAECETRSWADLKKAQRDAEKAAGGAGYWYGRGAVASDPSTGKSYPPGTEYALIHAEAQLMNAVVAVMHESLTEGIRGFYKLRKAFLTLDGIMEAEAKIRKRVHPQAIVSGDEPKQQRMSDDIMPGSFDEAEFADLEKTVEKESDSDAEFVDASAGVSGAQTPTGVTDANKPESTGTPNGVNAASRASRPPSGSGAPSLGQTATQPDVPPPPAIGSALEKIATGRDSLHFTSTRDVFVHSGANMCFGALLLVISMVPPAFSRLLQIVGFKGDRDRGVKMLWHSTTFPNANGAVAGLILLGYYNGLLAFADILPSDRDIEELSDPESDEVVGYPKERCMAVLADMRTRYPDSRLWKVEESRVFANTKRLDEAIKILVENSDSKMKQITALNTFELSLNSMFTMDWPLACKSFIACIELNEWSHTIYYYMAGCAELELYRDAQHKVPAEEATARQHKQAAEKLFRKAPAVAGRKKFMARQMPFEVFVCRKMQKWEERATALGVDLADAIGVSPAMEMIYLWNGSKKMSPDLLERARRLLPWERCTATPEQVAKIQEEKDEVGTQAVAEASLLRCLRRVEEARARLEPTLKTDKYVSTIFSRWRVRPCPPGGGSVGCWLTRDDIGLCSRARHEMITSSRRRTTNSPL